MKRAAKPQAYRYASSYDVVRSASACAVSGRLLAISTIFLDRGSWMLSQNESRLFRRADLSQSATTGLARDVYDFINEANINLIGVCLTDTGFGPNGAADEASIEAILQLVPGLEVRLFDNEAIREWSISQFVPLPPNMGSKWRGLTQLRSVELAMFMATDGGGDNLTPPTPPQLPRGHSNVTRVQFEDRSREAMA